jgi:hypothetical protein
VTTVAERSVIPHSARRAFWCTFYHRYEPEVFEAKVRRANEQYDRIHGPARIIPLTPNPRRNP